MRLRLTDQPLDLPAVVASVTGPDAGAVDVFIGTVRNHAKGRRVLRLEYEAYDAMVLEQFGLYAQEAQRRWPGARVAVHHRLGACEAGEPTVIVAVCTAHRAEAFEACRWVVERLKADAPIWKREVYEDGSAWVGQGS